ncbi:hypothetical protein [Streptomyces sp. HNM0574]|uniref:hypothetical protein n=1 Tax=Streptomyces sp. HNM0574 TaxID=2714954 RepID=UPI00146E2F7F|nr:hypothetical protein [Streptomyces sp. HNM0574]NLU67741.1 hypothetical protein [Streptomyces sp. HNM0574]
MALRRLGKDPESPEGKSPTVYINDATGHYVLQGWKVTDEERRQMDIPDHEDAIVLPRRMTQFLLEVQDGDRADA